jgi:hypothetical protein
VGVIAAGYGAGGAALSLLASSPLFTSRYPEVLGFVSIEGPPAWALEQESFPWEADPVPQGAFLERFRRFFLNLKPRKLSGPVCIEPLLIPSLFITSDHIKEETYRQSRYAALLDLVRNAKAPSRISSVAGAGFLDYTEGAKYYPLYQYLLPRPRSARSSSPGPAFDGCVSLIAGFAAALGQGGR